MKQWTKSTLNFISCRSRLTKVCAGAGRGEKGSKGREGRVRLVDVDTERLLGLKYKLICRIKLASWCHHRPCLPPIWNGTSTCLYFTHNSLSLSSANLTQPPLLLLPFFLLAAPAHTFVSLLLQLMKTCVGWKLLYRFTIISMLHWCLQMRVR